MFTKGNNIHFLTGKFPQTVFIRKLQFLSNWFWPLTHMCWSWLSLSVGVRSVTAFPSFLLFLGGHSMVGDTIGRDRAMSHLRNCLAVNTSQVHSTLVYLVADCNDTDRHFSELLAGVCTVTSFQTKILYWSHHFTEN